MATFENNPPDNRNVIITGAYIDMAHSLKYTLYHGSKSDPHPDVSYYAPLVDTPGQVQTTPKVVFKITQNELNYTKGQVSSSQLHVTRMTWLSMSGDVKEWMRSKFGDGADDMIVVEYGSQPGLKEGLIILGLGVVMLLIWGYSGRS